MRNLLALALLLILSLPAAAADTATRVIIGFSADGRRFAFEEFGRFDGSGFPYSSIYVIDTEKNEWAAPPVHIRLQQETALVSRARRLARERARPLLSGIAEPGEVLASQPIAQMVEAPDRLSFRTMSHVPNSEEPLVLELKEIEPAKPRDEEARGFRLTITEHGERRIVHEDRVLPAGRALARGYRMTDVIAYRPENRQGVAVLVVMILVLKQGFEGSDGRYIAVTMPLPSR